MLEWSDLNIRVVNNKKYNKSRYLEIIKNSSGSARKGEVLAIMGPSGGGKTTLLNALSGTIPPGASTYGKILYDQKIRDKTWLNKIGFVNQDDFVSKRLTVRETIRYSLLFRTEFASKNAQTVSSKSKKLSKLFYDPAVELKIQKMIGDLYLNNCADNLMSSVSGGERKRVMIGIELICDPDVLFLDEPTSGLDTLTALKIVRILKALASEYKKIVILTIHQPSSEIFFMIDKVILLHEGSTVYSGKTSEIESFFTSKGLKRRDLVTIPEFILEICSEEFKLLNPRYFYGEESIIKEDPLNATPKARINKNESYVDYSTNFYHVLLLLKKRSQVEISSKFEFFKLICAKLSSLMVVTAIICYIFHRYARDPPTLEKSIRKMYNIDFLNIDFEQNYDCLMASVRTAVAAYVLFACFFNQISACAGSIINEMNIIRKEISVATYTSTSLFLSLLLYYFILEFVTGLVFLGIFLVWAPGIATKGFAALLLLSPLASLPCGLFIASCTRLKNINKILTGLFCAVFSFDPTVICAFVNSLGIDKETKIPNTLGRLTLITFFCPTYHLSAYLRSRLMLEFDKRKTTPLILDLCKNLRTLDLDPKYNYIGGYEMKPFQILQIFFLSFIIIIISSVFSIGHLTRPELRYILQKNTGNKTQ